MEGTSGALRLAALLVVAFSSTPAPGQSTLAEAKRLLSEGDVARARKILETIDPEDPGSFEAESLLAWLDAQAGETERAIDRYRRLAERNPKSADVQNSLGALLLRARRLDEARRALESAIALDPALVMAHHNLGLLRFDGGELAPAAESFSKAIELEPDKPQYHLGLARAHRAAYRFDDSVAAYRSALERNPEPRTARQVRLELALALRLMGLLLESEKELEALLEIDAVDADARFQLARLRVAMNRYSEAEAELRRLVEESPGHVPAWFMLGFVQYRREEPERARASLRRLLEIDPDHAEGSFFLGMALEKLGEREGARAAFERALAADPEHLSASYNLALLFARLGEDEASRERLAHFRRLSERRERLDSLEERVRWNPDNASFHLELGREYARQKRTEEALQAFQRALELEPGLAAAEVALAELLAKGRP